MNVIGTRINSGDWWSTQQGDHRSKEREAIQVKSRFVFDEPLVVTRSKVKVFNQKHPVGSGVAVIKDDGEVIETTIVRRADILNGLVPVVWLDGISGAYSFDRVVG